MLRALLQPLTPVCLGWSGSGELATLTAVEARADPVTLAGEALLCGLYLNELVLRMTMRMDPQAELFDSMSERSTPGWWRIARLDIAPVRARSAGPSRLRVDLATDAYAAAPLATDLDYAYRHEHGPVVWRTRRRARLEVRLAALAADRKPPTTNFRRCVAGCARLSLRISTAANYAPELLGDAGCVHAPDSSALRRERCCVARQARTKSAIASMPT